MGHLRLVRRQPATGAFAGMSRDSRKFSAAQLGANPRTPHYRRRRWQSAWRVDLGFTALRTPITLIVSVLQPKETLRPYTRTHDDGGSRNAKRAKADTEPGPGGNRRGHWPKGAPQRASRRSRDRRVRSL
jgi:hypothetical protein